MKKRMLWSLLLICMMGIFAGCGNDLKNDVQEYQKFWLGLNEEARPIMMDFQAKTRLPNLNKDEKIAIMQDITGKLEAIAEKQKNYKPKTKEVQSVHEKAIKSLGLSIEGLKEMTIAAQNDTLDQNKIAEIMKKQEQVESLKKEASEELKALAEKVK